MPSVDYSIQYQSPKTAASVFAPLGWKESKSGKERRIAALLADNGYTIALRLEDTTRENVTNPDALSWENRKWIIWEFKAVGDDYANLSRSAQRKVHDAKDQSENVVIYFPARVTVEQDYIGQINRGLRIGLFHLRQSGQAEAVRQIILLHDSGKMQRLTKEQFDEYGFSGF